MADLSWYDAVSNAKGKGIIRVIDKFGYNPNNLQTVAYLRQLNSIYNGETVIGYLVVSGIENPLQMDFVPFDKYSVSIEIPAILDENELK